MPQSIESAVYSFEGLLPDLPSPPIAARRALDHAGLRLSVEGWRSLPLDERLRITLAGVADRVDGEAVAGLVRGATPGPQRVTPASDPDPVTPPEALARALEPTRGIDARHWARLRAVDRYALMHAYRRALARSAFSILGDAFDAVLAASTSSPPPRPSAEPEVSDVEDAGRRTPLPTSARVLSAGALSNHLNQAGEVHMVDVARKPTTERRAIARGTVHMRAETLARLVAREAPKGEVLATARIAAVMAAKRTPELIPLCHQVALTHVDVAIDVDEAAEAVHVTATADAFDRTGCEMEAMVAVSAACLTIYDMLKGIDRDMIISDVKLMEKSGGRSGHYRRGDREP